MRQCWEVEGCQSLFQTEGPMKLQKGTLWLISASLLKLNVCVIESVYRGPARKLYLNPVGTSPVIMTFSFCWQVKADREGSYRSFHPLSPLKERLVLPAKSMNRSTSRPACLFYSGQDQVLEKQPKSKTNTQTVVEENICPTVDKKKRRLTAQTHYYNPSEQTKAH